MKRVLYTLAGAALLAAGMTVAAHANNNDKITICHAAGKDGTTHHVTLTISVIGRLIRLLMTEMVKVTVRLPREVHAEVRARAFREGTSMDELGKRWFGEYADGGLAAGGQRERENERSYVEAPALPGGRSSSAHSDTPNLPSPAASPPVRTDWKKGKR